MSAANDALRARRGTRGVHRDATVVARGARGEREDAATVVAGRAERIECRIEVQELVAIDRHRPILVRPDEGQEGRAARIALGDVVTQAVGTERIGRVVAAAHVLGAVVVDALFERDFLGGQLHQSGRVRKGSGRVIGEADEGTAHRQRARARRGKIELEGGIAFLIGDRECAGCSRQQRGTDGQGKDLLHDGFSSQR